ncbi:hypothetical protein EVAR_37702_1 [Eumeta japonica]|uniref:Uncharacterized protein n=1 Tax=Eumeta variegata TaxID=151549 RepID=A0A4C1XU08_EUMVA|nr:hypothetical protein EVAR_37702_1 [Eumeta japonica]
MSILGKNATRDQLLEIAFLIDFGSANRHKTRKDNVHDRKKINRNRKGARLTWETKLIGQSSPVKVKTGNLLFASCPRPFPERTPSILCKIMDYSEGPFPCKVRATKASDSNLIRPQYKHCETLFRNDWGATLRRFGESS